MNEPTNRMEALRNFDSARRKARRSELSSRLTGKDGRLLSFEVIRDEMRLTNPLYKGIEQIEVDQIIGSLGRYEDFTRHFLPLTDSARERWVGIEGLAAAQGWPPIEAYQIGNVYFIKDGNHRTAVARGMGNKTIEAHVWAFPTAIEIDADANIDEILAQAGEQVFLERTKIDALVPDYNIRFTIPGQYQELLAQIEDLSLKLAKIDGERPSPEDAVMAWYEIVYLPTVQIISDSTLLQDFTGRTEADLFAWLSRHRNSWAETVDGTPNLADLAQLLADDHKERGLSKVTRQVRNLLGGDLLPPLEATPPSDEPV